MSALCGSVHQFQACQKLRRVSLVILKAQTWVAADLPKPHKFSKYLHLIFLKFLSVLHGNLLTHMYHLCVI